MVMYLKLLVNQGKIHGQSHEILHLYSIYYVIRRSSRLKATGFKVLWKLWNAMWKKFPVLPQYRYVDLPY